MLLCRTGFAFFLLLSPGLAFLYYLVPFSFVLLSFIFVFSSFVCLFAFVCFAGRAMTHPFLCLAQYTGLYLRCQVLVRFSVSVHACSFQISFFVLWLSILLKFVWYGYMIII